VGELLGRDRLAVCKFCDILARDGALLRAFQPPLRVREPVRLGHP
jgi:hypothetical protein